MGMTGDEIEDKFLILYNLLVSLGFCGIHVDQYIVRIAADLDIPFFIEVDQLAGLGIEEGNDQNGVGI